MATTTRRRAPQPPAPTPADLSPDTAATPAAPKKAAPQKAAPKKAAPKKPVAAQAAAPEAPAEAASAPAAKKAPAKKAARKAAAPQPMLEPTAVPVPPVTADAGPAEEVPTPKAAAPRKAPRKKAVAAEVDALAPAAAKKPRRKPAAPATPEVSAVSAVPAEAPTEAAADASTEPVVQAVVQPLLAPTPEAPVAEALETPVEAPEALQAEAAPTADAELESEPEPEPEHEPEHEPEPEAEPEPEPPRPSRLTLAEQPHRHLVWWPGNQGEAAAREALGRLLAPWRDRDLPPDPGDEAHGALRLDDLAELETWCEQARRLGHPVAVDEAIWPHLAAHGDVRQRIARLERACAEQGLAQVLAPGGVGAAVPLPPGGAWRPCQLEAAFFAASAGSCLLHDDAAIGPEHALALGLALLRGCFGAQGLVIVAPEARWPAWHAALGEPLDAEVLLLAPGAALPAAAEAVLLDMRGASDAAALMPPAEALAVPWCWLLADPRVLVDQPEAAAAALQALDRLGRGLVARWQAGGPRKLLAPLALGRRWVDVADQWPAWQTQACTMAPLPAAAAGMADRLRQRLLRQQASGYLPDSEQLALRAEVRALHQLQQAAALQAAIDWLAERLAAGERRLLVFGPDDALLADLAVQAQARGLPVVHLPQAGACAEAEALLRSFRDAPDAQVLLSSDGPDGMDGDGAAEAAAQITLAGQRPQVLMLGACDAALQARRLARVRAPRAERGLGVWCMQPAEGGPLPGLLPAAGSRQVQRGEALAAWLAEVAAAL